MLTKDDKVFIASAISGAMKENNKLIFKHTDEAIGKNNEYIFKHTDKAIAKNNELVFRYTDQAIVKNNELIFRYTDQAIIKNNELIFRHMDDSIKKNNTLIFDRVDKSFSENNKLTFKHTDNSIAKNNNTIFDLFNHLDQKMDGIEKNLKSEIRHNGILIEQNSDSIQILAEGQSSLNDRMLRLENDMDTVIENTTHLPMLQDVSKNHSRRLTKLEGNFS